MKKTKFQIQRRTNVNGNEEMKDYGRTLTPLKALVRMDDLALADIKLALSHCAEVTISRTSDSLYPDSWGYANNGILIKVHSYYIQWEVVEV